MIDRQTLTAAGIDCAHYYYAARILSRDAECPTRPTGALKRAIRFIEEQSMPRGRKAAPAPQLVETNIDMTLVRGDLQAADQLGALVAANTGEMVVYDRTETLARVRGLMAHGTQVMLELGAALVWMRQHEPEADFRELVESIGLDVRTASRFMQAGRKFQLALSEEQRGAFQALSRGKLYELLVLDDEEVADLASGLEVAGLKLDDIDTMSTSELRRTLREERAKAKSDAEVLQRMVKAKNERQNQLEDELDALRHGGKDVEKGLAMEREEAAIAAFSEASLELLTAVQKFDQAVADCLVERTEARITLAEQNTVWLFQRIAQIATERGMQVDFERIVEPEWVRALQAAEQKVA